MININLLPPEIKTKLKQRKKVANIFSICLVAVIVIVVATFLLRTYKDSVLKSQLDSENTKIAAANKELTNFNDLQDKALFLNDRGKLATEIESTRPNWSQILDGLLSATPTDVQLISLTSDVTKSPNFIMQGNTTTDREAIKFKDKLASIAFFKDVAFKSSTVDNSQNPADANNANTNIRFTLEFNLAQFSIKEGTK